MNAAAVPPEVATVAYKRRHGTSSVCSVQAAASANDDDDDDDDDAAKHGPRRIWNHLILLRLGWQGQRYLYTDQFRCLLVVVVVVFLGVLLCDYVIVPPMYEFWIQRHPQWVFRPGTTIAVFFHVYIPPNKGKRGIQEALNIVQEQLSQIGSSSSNRGAGNLLDNLSIYFTTTGVKHVAKRQAEQTCYLQNLNCHWMGHWEQGQEDLTLSRLYQYCQHSPTAKVVYIHTKGSYHANGGRNHAWRWHLTQAALTCAQETTTWSNYHCNLCGLQFYPVWTTFYPGNMWTASCSYVNQLWSPHEFGRRLETVIESARDDKSNKFVWTLYNASNPGNLGLGRYAMEHWIASHPLVRPCEIATDSPHLEVWYSKNVTQSKAVLQAPQHGWETGGWFRWNATRVRKLLLTPKVEKEYFLLPGLTYKWQQLYHQVPPLDSWVWKWYPDGRYWQKFLYQH